MLGVIIHIQNGCSGFDTTQSSSQSSTAIKDIKNNDNDKNEDAEILELISKVESGKVYYSEKCASCHNSIDNSTKRNSTSKDIKAGIVSQSAMAFLKDISQNELDLISLALNVDIQNQIANYFENKFPENKKNENFITYVKPLIGTRTYLASTLESLFVAESEERNSEDNKILQVILNLILKQSGALGGPCQSRYEGSIECPGSAKLNNTAEMLPLPNSLRKGYMLRSCEEILAKDRAIHNALEKSKIETTSTADPGKISQVFNLFYPGRLPTSEVINELVNSHDIMLTKGQGPLNAWRFTLLSLCKSSMLELL